MKAVSEVEIRVFSFFIIGAVADVRAIGKGVGFCGGCAKTPMAAATTDNVINILFISNHRPTWRSRQVIEI